MTLRLASPTDGAGSPGDAFDARLAADVERLRERLEFEALITEISARLVVATPETIDRALRDALERLRSAISADRAVLFEYADDWNGGLITHAAYGSGVPALPERVNVQDLFPWVDQELQSGRTVDIPDVSLMPPQAGVDQANFQRLVSSTLLIVPVSSSRGFSHAVIVDTAWKPRTWPALMEPRLRLLGEVMVSARLRNRHEVSLTRAVKELEALKDRLESENLYLRHAIVPRDPVEGIVATSGAMTGVLEMVHRVAPTDSAVLLLGETGTGKELLARAIHRLSARKDRLLVAVNCAALPASLVESELFGREKGAYTGALTRQAGRFELADRSTLFLDEVGELPLDLQAKLLRVLETGEFERLGTSRTTKVDVRIVAATNRDLAAAMAAGTFRPDLYYRLSVFPIRIAPLRERPEDIPALVWAMVKELDEKIGRRVDTIPKRVIEALQRYSWPGNVRELRNVVERGLILGHGGALDIALDLEAGVERAHPVASDLTLKESERRLIIATLARTDGRVRGAGGAAERLGIHEATLRSRMKTLGIDRRAR
jgi:transcriptional regulator with GAF, ATPase, and Fis domain